MRVELTPDDIIHEVEDCYPDDIEFIVDIANNATSTWEKLLEVAKGIVDVLKASGKLTEKDKEYLLGE